MPAAKSVPAPRRPLTRERIVEAAIALADAAGTDLPTMRALGAALDVQPMSLYHHIGGKEELVDAMVDHVYGEIDLPGDGDWRSALTRRYESARRVLRRHPWAVPLMESRLRPGPHNLQQHDAVIGVLLRAGFSMAMTAHAYSMLDAYLYGFVLQEIALPFQGPHEIAGVAEQMLAAFPADAYPNLVALMAGHVMLPGYDYADEFDIGLGLLLDTVGASLTRD